MKHGALMKSTQIYKSMLPVTYQQGFSKEAAGSLKSNMAYGEAQLCIISFNVKKKKKKEIKINTLFFLHLLLEIFFKGFWSLVKSARSFGHHN